MLNLEIKRTKLLPTHTVGQLYVGGEYLCFTLEDVVREKPGVPVEKWKIRGETAIPEGTYRVTLENSPRFGKDTVTIHNVPGFSFIRIHAGNSAKDTEGCPLIGYSLTHDNIIRPGTTRPAVAELKKIVREAVDRNEDVVITIGRMG